MRARGQLSGRAATRAADHALDGAVVFFGAGTVAYHATLLTHSTRTTLIVVWLLVVAVFAVVARTLEPSEPQLEPTPTRSAAITFSAIAVAGAGALYARTTASWWWAYWCATVSGLAVVLLINGREAPSTRSLVTPPEAHAPRTLGVAAVIIAAAAFAVASLITVRPDLDDVYVVNRSVYVEANDGPITTNDTVYTDREVAGQRPALRSPAYEVLIGSVAALAPVRSGTVLYLWVAPLMSAFAVFAVWRLARTAGAPRAELVAVAAATFLLLDGSKHGGFGNFAFGRLWQGKVVLVAVVVPLLWAYAIRWVRDGSRRDLGLLATANVAAAGLSSTGLFVAPLATILVAAGAALGARRPSRLAIAAAATAYPLGLAVLNRAAEPQLQETGGRIATLIAPWHRWAFVFGQPVLALVAVALAFAWAATRDRVGRTVLVFVPLAMLAGLYGPEAVDPLRTIAPASASILWRAVWVTPVPTLIGLALSAPLVTRGRYARLVTIAAVGAAGAWFVITTTPVMSSENGASLAWARWDVGGELAVAQRLVTSVPTGSLVAGPFDVDRVVPLISADVRAVDPRPGWQPAGVDPMPRRLVQQALTTGLADVDVDPFVRALNMLGVRGVAVPDTLDDDLLRATLTAEGFVRVADQGQYEILTR